MLNTNLSQENAVAIAIPSNVASGTADADNEVIYNSATKSETESDCETTHKWCQTWLEAQRDGGDQWVSWFLLGSAAGFTLHRKVSPMS